MSGKQTDPEGVCLLVHMGFWDRVPKLYTWHFGPSAGGWNVTFAHSRSEFWGWIHIVPVLVSATSKMPEVPAFVWVLSHSPLCSSTNRGVSTQCLYGFDQFPPLFVDEQKGLEPYEIRNSEICICCDTAAMLSLPTVLGSRFCNGHVRHWFWTHFRINDGHDQCTDACFVPREGYLPGLERIADVECPTGLSLTMGQVSILFTTSVVFTYASPLHVSH